MRVRVAVLRRVAVKQTPLHGRSRCDASRYGASGKKESSPFGFAMATMVRSPKSGDGEAKSARVKKVASEHDLRVHATTKRQKKSR